MAGFSLDGESRSPLWSSPLVASVGRPQGVVRHPVCVPHRHSVGVFCRGNWRSAAGMTCWRRLRDWHEAGVWRRLHELLLAELHATGLVQGRSRAVIDSSHFRALKGGPKPDRARSTVP